jgi:DNA-binding MltR family transcriptional regulator
MAPKTKHTDLVEESDRGCVLVAAAMLEESLEKIFRIAFNAKHTSKALQDSLFDSNGPLATLSAKIRLAYALGFIPSDVYRDLEDVRKLRNEAAHTAKDFNFLDDSVGARIESLHCVQAFRESFRRYSLQDSQVARKPKAKRDIGSSDQGGRVHPGHEAQVRSVGFVKYRKAILALGIRNLIFYLDTGMWLGNATKGGTGTAD